MQPFKQIKEVAESNDTPHTSRAGTPSQQFLNEIFEYTVGDTNQNIGLSTQSFIDTGATRSIINCETFTKIEKFQPLVVMPLGKSTLAANGYSMPKEGKVVVQPAFDLE